MKQRGNACSSINSTFGNLEWSKEIENIKPLRIADRLWVEGCTPSRPYSLSGIALQTMCWSTHRNHALARYNSLRYYSYFDWEYLDSVVGSLCNTTYFNRNAQFRTCSKWNYRAILWYEQLNRLDDWCMISQGCCLLQISTGKIARQRKTTLRSAWPYIVSACVCFTCHVDGLMLC